MERIIDRKETAYKMLETVASMLNVHAVLNHSDTVFTVGDCYFDYGQDWMWTTIIADNPNKTFGSYQVLNPVEWRTILLAESVEDIIIAFNSVILNPYFSLD